jgi:UDP-3-O-[3-hydroxymyristoyl] glucosamine N-acyltransferase
MAARRYTLEQLAEIVGGEVRGDGSTVISGIAGIKEAKKGDITFLANPAYEEFLGKTRASAVIGPTHLECQKPLIRIENPYLAFLRVLTLFAEEVTAVYPRGVHETAIVDPSAKLGDNISIGPFCQIRKGVTIGTNTTIVFSVFIGDDVTIGDDCLIYPNVTVREKSEIGNRVIVHSGAVIGADGFGFAKDGHFHQKIPQIGRVIIEDDVELGANSAVDRATTGITRVCRGSKIDNLVQIAHNVKIGENSIIAAQAGVSGSTELGKNVVLGGQAGLVGHIKIGDDAQVGAQAGVTKSIPSKMRVSGYPAREHEKALKLSAYAARLPELFKKVKELEARLEELDKGDVFGTAAKNDR